jgi:hypothetical protein
MSANTVSEGQIVKPELLKNNDMDMYYRRGVGRKGQMIK